MWSVIVVEEPKSEKANFNIIKTIPAPTKRKALEVIKTSRPKRVTRFRDGKLSHTYLVMAKRKKKNC